MVRRNLRIKLPTDGPIIVCFGGGVDSTALLIALYRAGIRPDVISFADVGGEKPETYEHVRFMDAWLRHVGFPTVTWCKKVTTDRVEYSDLEGNCLANETLPSLAFGMKSCSIKWKQGPQDHLIRGCLSGPNRCPPHPIWIEARARGVKPLKLLGYDAGPADLRRSKNLKNEDGHFRYAYVLQQLGWDRGACIRVILEECLPVPLKSACWFCPASKVWELWWLAGWHPELFMRALRMEWIALTGRHSRFDEVEFGASWEEIVKTGDRFPSTTTTVGLGRNFAWNQWARVHGITNDQGEFVADTEFCRRRAEQLQAANGGGNAADSRGAGCGLEAAVPLFADAL